MNNIKDIPYVENLPKNWKAIQNRFLFKETKDKVGDKFNEYQLLSLTTKGIKEKNINATGGKVPESYENYQKVNSGQMVFCLFDLDCSAVFSGISNLDGMITSAYNVYDNKELMNNKYADYWFQYVFSNRYYKMYSKSIRYTITGDMFKSIKTPVPPMSEQIKISNYLDDKCVKIDLLIKNQEEQIENLKAYKQSLITETVTKGLNPNVEMKDSGVLNLGNIPKHWKVRRLKYIANSFSKGSGITKEQIVANGDTPCIRYGEIYTKYNYIFDKCCTRTNKNVLSSLNYFSYGDVLFTTTGELVEEIGKSVVYTGNEKCLAGGDVVIMQHSQNPQFMGFALGSLYAQEQKSRGKAKLKVVHTSASALGNINIVLPPLEEQKDIAYFLNDKCEKINELIELKQSKINELNEYKKSLIYEYVTGKKQV